MRSPQTYSPYHSSDVFTKRIQCCSALQEIEANVLTSASTECTTDLKASKALNRRPIRAAVEAMDHGREFLMTPPPSSPYIDLRIPLQHSGSVHIMATSKAKALSPTLATPPPSSPPFHHPHHNRTPSITSAVPVIPDELVVEIGHPVVIGRMAKPLDASKTGPHLTQPGSVQFYTLPLKELEVSRLHSVVERVPGGVRLKAIGKNGLRVGHHFVAEGQEMILPEQKGLVNLDLWVRSIKLQCALPHAAAPRLMEVKREEPPHVKELEDLKEYTTPHTATSAVFSEATIPITPSEDRHMTTSLPPSSPASSPLSSLSSDDEMSPPRGVKRKAGSLPPSSPVKRIAMSEQSGDEDMDADGEENEDDEQDQDQEDHQDNGEEVPRKDNEDEDDDLLGLLVQQSARAPPSTSVYTEEPAPKLQNQNGSHHSASPQLPLPKPRRTAEEEIQFRIAVLPHLVTALALSVTTTTPLSHILPEVLEQSSLASYDHEDITEMCRTLLEDGVKGMFGKVVRRGKDASGRPLENVYFYNADKDPDRERGRNLGNLGGRRVRHAQMTDKQYYWRPVGRKRT